MTSILRAWTALALLVCLQTSIAAQTLADLARKERERRSQDQNSKRVFTNADLNKYETESSSPVELSASAVVGNSQKAERKTANPPDADQTEEAWSKRFIEAKSKVQDAKARAETLQNKLNDLNMKLMSRSDVYDRENVYQPLIAQTRQELEKTKNEMTSSQQALADLREELRKSGNPVSWENSQAALKSDANKEQEKDKNKNRDQQYWQDKLSTIDKRYTALISPLEAERFQLLNRRSPKEGEPVAGSGTLGLGAPPRVIDIDVQIKELQQKREHERQELVQSAIREGALPGWFR